jgi:hypothetical protein
MEFDEIVKLLQWEKIRRVAKHVHAKINVQIFDIRCLFVESKQTVEIGHLQLNAVVQFAFPYGQKSKNKK